MWQLVLAAMALLLLIVVFLRIWLVLQQIRASSAAILPLSSILKQQRTALIKTVVVLGSGGHTTEMLELVKNLSPHYYTPLIYIIATTDTTSEQRVHAHAAHAQQQQQQQRRRDLSNVPILRIPRSREVGQSYASSIVTTLWSFVHAIWLVARLRPGLVLCNGPGTCLPIAISAFLFRILGVCEGKIVFVESFCRVERYVVLLFVVIVIIVVERENGERQGPKHCLFAWLTIKCFCFLVCTLLFLYVDQSVLDGSSLVSHCGFVCGTLGATERNVSP
jgi:beta-1,4-N-acetylglucosaminyltransferase